MTAVEMVAHINDGLRLALGDLPSRPHPSPLRLPPLKQAAVYWLPIPRGVSGPPELTARLRAGPPLNWSDEQAAFPELLDQFGRKAINEAWPEHPVFGPLSARAWGVLSLRHTEYHLQQFGL
jgi:hypothetical protein